MGGAQPVTGAILSAHELKRTRAGPSLGYHASTRHILGICATPSSAQHHPMQVVDDQRAAPSAGAGSGARHVADGGDDGDGAAPDPLGTIEGSGGGGGGEGGGGGGSKRLEAAVLHNVNQFHKWHAELEAACAMEQDEKYRRYGDLLASHVATCDAILAQVSAWA
jgi:hypothetical protein